MSAGGGAKKRFGQHFLHERRVLEKIVDALALSPQDFLIEIGPGEGALTRHLSGKAHLEVVEIDRDLAGSGRADPGSLIEAVKLAIQLASPA